ncbi:MAG: hypothetical protein QG671_4240 [Actinomycetota bacterium]|nr:hypothetical protein [Actinomycetota bacterium]
MLDKFEQRVDKMVNGAFAKAFKSEVQPVEIAAALQKEMDERAAVVSRARTVVPNDFTVFLSADDYERLSVYSDTLTAELAGIAREYATEQRYSFLGPVSVELREEAELTTGLLKVRSQAQATDGRSAEYRPHLLAAGQQIPLTGSVVRLGRGNDVDVRLEDPGVSRHHAEVIVGQPPVLQDLGSTNGTFLNGNRVTRSELAEGDVVRLGSTELVYRSDG